MMLNAALICAGLAFALFMLAVAGLAIIAGTARVLFTLASVCAFFIIAWGVL